MGSGYFLVTPLEIIGIIYIAPQARFFEKDAFSKQNWPIYKPFLLVVAATTKLLFVVAAATTKLLF